VKLLCLGSKLIKIIIFILNTLRGCSLSVQNTPRATSAWILLVNKRRGESYWLIPNWHIYLLLYSNDTRKAPSVALWALKMSHKLLNAHSKYGRRCSFYHIGTVDLHDVNRDTPPPYFKCALSRLGYALSSSMRILNKNDNFEWFWSLSIRTSHAHHKL
jgi:hypothetical protein